MVQGVSVSQTARLVFAGTATAILLLDPINLPLWLACLAALATAIWIAGGWRTHPAFLCLILLFWIAIAADILLADLQGRSLIHDIHGSRSRDAIVFSLCALLALATGMRCGADGWRHFRRKNFSTTHPDWKGGAINLKRALVCYFVALVTAAVANRVAFSVPGLTQPLLTVELLKYCCIYVVAFTVFQEGRGFAWLGVIAGLEILIGALSVWSQFKEPIFIILLAMAPMRTRLPVAHVVIALAAVLVLLWMSLVWTESKMDYRRAAPRLTTDQKITWVYQTYVVRELNYDHAVANFADRVGYTKMFAKLISLREGNVMPEHVNFYAHSLQHIVTPRLLFPDKLALNDSAITMELLGMHIDRNTSISIGYVAQAYLDFGFPFMLVPIFSIGLMLGLACSYFMSRPVGFSVRTAFAVSCIFNSFQYESDIDKSLGGFVTHFVVLALIMKFGLPYILDWLEDARIGDVPTNSYSVAVR